MICFSVLYKCRWLKYLMLLNAHPLSPPHMLNVSCLLFIVSSVGIVGIKTSSTWRGDNVFLMDGSISSCLTISPSTMPWLAVTLDGIYHIQDVNLLLQGYTSNFTFCIEIKLNKLHNILFVSSGTRLYFLLIT